MSGKDRRRELLKAYGETYDYNLACNRIRATDAERREWDEDKSLKLEMDAILSGCYAVGISSLTDMIKVMTDLKWEEREIRDETNPSMTKIVRKPTDMGKWVTSYSMTQMRAIDQLQELIAKQLEATRKQDDILHFVFEKITGEEMESDPKVEIVRGSGDISWDYGKGGDDDSISGELKRKIEKGVKSGEMVAGESQKADERSDEPDWEGFARWAIKEILDEDEKAAEASGDDAAGAVRKS